MTAIGTNNLVRLHSKGVYHRNRVIHAIPIRIQRQRRVNRPQPRILLQEPAHRRVVPARADFLQPARQRLVPIAPQAVPVVGLTRTCYRVAKRIGNRRR